MKPMQHQSPHDPLRKGDRESTGAAIPVGKTAFQEVAGPGAVTSGRLAFIGGAVNVTLAVAPSLVDLYRAQFKEHLPEVRVNGGIVTLTFPHGFGPADWDRAQAAITLNGALPWEIEFGSVSNLNAVLSELQLRALDVTGNLSRGLVTLPSPAGIVFVRIAGSVSHLCLQRPAGIAVRIVLRQAVTSLTVDDQHVAAVSGELSLETPGYQQMENRYDIEVVGSASDLTITTETVYQEG